MAPTDRSYRNQRNWKAFTLVELLVTIAIVAVLAVVVLPTVGAARERAEEAKCLSNLKALGGAISLYLTDHNMRMPTLNISGSRTNDVPKGIDKELGAYVDDKRVFCCPADKVFAKVLGTSYDGNPLLSEQPFAALDFDGITDHSKICVLIDKEDWHSAEDGKDVPYTVDGKSYSLKFGKANHLFADGHVAKEERILASPIFPGEK